MSEKTNVRDIEKERFLAELRIKLEEAAENCTDQNCNSIMEIL